MKISARQDKRDVLLDHLKKGLLEPPIYAQRYKLDLSPRQIFGAGKRVIAL
jgi:hypothetical protein